MSGLRILHIIAGIDPAGGGPIEGLRQHVAIRAQLGITTTIASLDPPPPESIAGATCVPLGRGVGKYRFQRGVVDRLRKLASSHDVAVINGLWQYHAIAARRALAGHLPYVVFTHGMLDPWYNRAYPLRAIKKHLYWPLGDYPVLRDASAVCFTSETERILARQSFRPYCAREVVVSYGTAMPPAASIRQRTAFVKLCPQAANQPYILFLSRLHAKKGCDLLIEAFASIARRRPELLLVMAGPDQDGWASALRALANRHGLANRVLWPGMLQGEAKWGAFYGAEAFCLPSHQENFGIAVAEALACGLPVLISDQVNIWREVAGDDAGLVEADTLTGSCRLLDRWLNLDQVQRQNMSLAASSCFSRRFEIHRAADSLLHVLRQAISGRRPARFSC